MIRFGSFVTIFKLRQEPSFGFHRILFFKSTNTTSFNYIMTSTIVVNFL